MPNHFAAIDLGSNSFHMIVAREDDGYLHLQDRISENVRLGNGLDTEGNITPEAEAIALECLARFSQRLREMPYQQVRAVGTNTLRRAKNSNAFLRKAHHALGHRIDIISGREEARLIYLGVAKSQTPAKGQQLVIDIGGGSTELIVGQGITPVQRESLSMGCVVMSQQHFPDGVIDTTNLRKAITHALLIIRPVARQFRELETELTLGASGTIKAIAAICQAMGWCDNGISSSAMEKLHRALLNAGHPDKLKLKGLNDKRRPVLAGGFAVLYALFKALHLQHIEISSGALREGVLYELIGRSHHEDVRQNTVQALLRRHNMDSQQAQRVEETALSLLTMLEESWELEGEEEKNMLSWAAQLHEVGLAIAHAGHHKHGAYLLSFADLPGFSRFDQQQLAALVRAQRGKFPLKYFTESLADELHSRVTRLSIILRLAILLHRGRNQQALPFLIVKWEQNELTLGFPHDWLAQHPLTHAELQRENELLKSCQIKLTVA
ncbi:MAG: Ppx/GppA phosphatase family protein [Gammaproteobacteria bacterium]|nr:Ppx/GppA phosphatase family protein [Gammaproteobacteria bacterium]